MQSTYSDHNPQHPAKTQENVEQSPSEQTDHQLQKRIVRLIECIPDAFVALDSKWRVTHINHQAEILAQNTREELLGKTFWEAFPETLGALSFTYYQQAVTTGKALHFEEVAPGLKKWFRVHVSPTEEGLYIYFNDITEQKKAEAQLQFQANILRNVRDGVIVTDPQEEVIYWNEGATSLFGYTAEEMLGKTLAALFPALDQSQLVRGLGEILKGKTYTGELQGQRRDETSIWIDAKAAPLLNTAGETIGLIGIVRDITERKRAQEQLKESEERFRSLSRCSPVGIFFTDTQGKGIYENPRCEEIGGWASGEGLGEGWVRFVHPDDVDTVVQEWIKASHEDSEYDQVLRFVHPDGMVRWTHVRSTPMFSDTGELLGRTGTIEDITEAKELEQRKDEFLSMASHELKTPLTIVGAYQQILQEVCEQEGNSEALLYLSKMEAQINNLTRLVADLLDISKIQAGKVAFTEEACDVDALVREVVENVQRTSPKYRILIEGTLTQEIVADKERLGQVLINLLTNAIKYSPQVEKVVVRLSQTQEQITVSVQDFGIGISKQHQEKIFERFHRVSSEKNKTYPGLGIGLYISHEIIQRHGGKMWVESAEGKGSTFSFSLPLR